MAGRKKRRTKKGRVRRRGSTTRTRKRAKKMGDVDKYEDTDEGRALHEGMQLAEIEQRSQLLRQHSHLESIGLPKNALFHDICRYLSDLEKISKTDGVWNSEGLLELDSMMPLLTVTPDGRVSHISPAKWTSGVWFGKDKLTRGAILAKGGYGAVYHGTLNGKAIAIKVPMQEAQATPQQIVSMYAENVIHAELFCYLRTLRYVQNRASIPKPLFFAKYFFRAGYRRVLGMEKLTGSLHQWMRDLHTLGPEAGNMFLQMLKSVALLLGALQKHYRFCHRDLHASNVMYQTGPGGKSSFRWYLIDFGMATMVVKGHHVNAGETPPQGRADRLPAQAPAASNNGHDMRTLILSLSMTDIRRAIPPGPTLEWIERLRENLLAGLDEHSIRLDLNRDNFHRAYDDAFRLLQSPSTEPEAIINDIESLERHHAATRVQAKARQRSARKKTTQRRTSRGRSRSRSSSKLRPRPRSRSRSRSAAESALHTKSHSKSRTKSKPTAASSSSA